MKNKSELKKLKTIKTKNQIITIRDMEKIEKLYKQGYRLYELDEAYERKRGTIARLRRLLKAGKDINVIQYAERFDYGKLEALLNANWSKKKLAEEFRTDITDIEKRIKELKKRNELQAMEKAI